LSWFVYLVTETVVYGDEVLKKGEKGVGMCSMAPGIMEAPHGIMYVVPEEYVAKAHKDKRQKRACASIVEDAVRSYFGITL